MIPYPYNMVDMGGIDLAEANGTVVEGLYAKIVEAINACGDTVLYNWKFAGIEIAPQHTQILLGVGSLTINTLIQVTEQDVVTVLGIAPPPPPVVPVEPLNASENGVYTATPPVSGFNPVNVTVPAKVLVPLSVAENGEYDPSDYNADGFSAVDVDVASAGSYNATRVWTQSIGGSNASLNVQEGIVSGVTFTPTSDAVNILYSTVQPTERLFSQIGVRYSGQWIIRALEKLYYSMDTASLNEDGTISWAYNVSSNYVFYFKEE